jgi:hypothetical protein
MEGGGCVQYIVSGKGPCWAFALSPVRERARQRKRERERGRERERERGREKE